MTRRKKEVLQKTDLSSPEAVPYILEFARNLEFSLYGGLPGNVFTPLTTNARLKDISLASETATESNIVEALNNAKNSENKLLAYAEDLEIKSMPFKRMILYLSRMLSFNLDYVCINSDVDYKSREFLKDRDRVRSFFDKFDYVSEFTNVMDVLVREDFYGCQLRRDYSLKYGLQQLPSKYLTITGRNPTTTLNFDMDVSFLLNAGIDLNLFSPKFKEFYQQAFGDKIGRGYVPSMPLGERNGSWSYWVQTDPMDGFYAFKFTPQMGTRIPFFSGLMPDIVLMPTYRMIAKTNAWQSAVKYLVSQVPFNKDNKGGSLSNNFSVSADNLGKFLQLIRNSIDSTIGVTAAPLEQFQSVSYDMPNKNAQTENLLAVSANSGLSTRLLFSVDKSNILESTEGANLDAYTISLIYSQFQRFLDLYANQETKKYKFKFLLSGVNFNFAKEKLKKDAIEMANFGVFMPTKFAHSLGYSNPFDFERALELAKSQNWDTEKLIKIIPATQMSKELGQGRPQSDLGDLSDSGGDSRSAGSNIEKGGEI